MANEALHDTGQALGTGQNTTIVEAVEADGQLVAVSSLQELTREEGIDEIPEPMFALEELRDSPEPDAQQDSELVQPAPEETPELTASPTTSSDIPTVADEPSPSVEEELSAEPAIAENQGLLGEITSRAKGLWNRFTGRTPESNTTTESAATPEPGNESPSLMDRVRSGAANIYDGMVSVKDKGFSLYEAVTVGVGNAKDALLNSEDENKSLMERIKDCCRELVEPILPPLSDLFSGFGDFFHGTWTSIRDTVQEMVKPQKADDRHHNFIHECRDYLLNCREHLKSPSISATAEQFSEAAEQLVDGLESKHWKSNLLRDQYQRRLEGIAEALEEYARAVEEEEKEEELQEDIYIVTQEERERLAEMVESLIAGTEDHPELVRYIHDDYRQILPVSELVEMMLSLKREREERTAVVA